MFTTLQSFLLKADAEILGEALKCCFGHRSTELPQNLSATLSAIDTKSLERGWISATASLPDNPQFKPTFETIIELIGKMERSFPN